MLKNDSQVKMNKNTFNIINMQKPVDFVQNKRIIKKMACCETAEKSVAEKGENG